MRKLLWPVVLISVVTGLSACSPQAPSGPLNRPKPDSVARVSSVTATPVNSPVPADTATPASTTGPAAPLAPTGNPASTPASPEATAGNVRGDAATNLPSAARGQKIFSQTCFTCHGEQGAGDGVAAASLEPKPANFTDLDFVRSKKPAELFETIKNGWPPMPAWGATYDQGQIWDVLFYELSFSTTAEGLQNGAAVYQQYCQSCHAGSGRGVADGGTAPVDLTDLEAYTAQSPAGRFELLSSNQDGQHQPVSELGENDLWNVLDYLRTFVYEPPAGKIAAVKPAVETEPEPTATEDTEASSKGEIGPAAGQPEAISFKADVLPIFIANCVRCHSDTGILDAPPNNLRLTDYENILKGSAFGPVIQPGNPAGSLLAIMLRKGTMPADTGKLPDEQVQTIVDWIAAGAPDN